MTTTAAEPPPNTEALERFMRAMFTQLITALARSVRGENMSVNEIAALHQIDQHGRLRISELAQLLDASVPNASRIAGRLVDLKLIERREDPADRRAKALTLTARGVDFIRTTGQERVQAALHAAAAMPGPVGSTIGDALQKLTGTPMEGPAS